MWTEREAIEVFHLLFLRALGARVDKALFALKGGCNLRFFHRSNRYSEDMDLDIRTMAPATLRSNVNQILDSAALKQPLLAQGIEIAHVSAPKQTATQRWKLTLILGRTGTRAPTKVEFSRRDQVDGTHLAPVNPEILRHYRLPPVLVQHYGAEAAFRQKIAALAQRTQTQARDIFDLKLLLDNGAGQTPLPGSTQTLIPGAIERAMSIGHDEFAGQVLAYLEPALQQDYRRRESWETLQEAVVDALRVRMKTP